MILCDIAQVSQNLCRNNLMYASNNEIDQCKNKE